jgi:hypothetical protein
MSPSQAKSIDFLMMIFIFIKYKTNLIGKINFKYEDD